MTCSSVCQAAHTHEASCMRSPLLARNLSLQPAPSRNGASTAQSKPLASLSIPVPSEYRRRSLYRVLAAPRSCGAYQLLGRHGVNPSLQRNRYRGLRPLPRSGERKGRATERLLFGGEIADAKVRSGSTTEVRRPAPADCSTAFRRHEDQPLETPSFSERRDQSAYYLYPSNDYRPMATGETYRVSTAAIWKLQTISQYESSYAELTLPISHARRCFQSIA